MRLGDLIYTCKNPVIWLCVLLILGLYWVGTLDAKDILQGNTKYCEMVELHEKSDGELGWPDYRATADEICLDRNTD